jgi:hypothetical protein
VTTQPFYAVPHLFNMRRFSYIQLLATLLTLLSASAQSQWRTRSKFHRGHSTSNKPIDPPPSPRLRQTTWQEIQARQVTRTSPNYKRQMASPVPITYPYCDVPYWGDIPVARFGNMEPIGGDVSFGTQDNRDYVSDLMDYSVFHCHRAHPC